MAGARLFLSSPADGDELVLSGEELEHARAQRLAVGDTVSGLDGRGHVWPLEVVALGRRELRLERAGAGTREPRAGTPGAALPWIELAIAWPRKNRAEPMLGALVQLGAAAITPLVVAQKGPEPVPATPPERWWKLAREALKQSGRAWLPELGGALALDALLEARADAVLCVLDPGGGISIDTWLRAIAAETGAALGTEERPITLIVGPEGGFDAEERDGLLIAGASPVWLGPHVLRIETAALAAMAVAAAVLGSPTR